MGLAVLRAEVKGLASFPRVFFFFFFSSLERKRKKGEVK